MGRVRLGIGSILAAMILVVAGCEFEGELPYGFSEGVEFIDDEAAEEHAASDTASNSQFARLGAGESTTYRFEPFDTFRSNLQVIWVRTRCDDPTAATVDVEVVDQNGGPVQVDGNGDPVNGNPIGWDDPCDHGSEVDSSEWSWVQVGSAAVDPTTFDMEAPGTYELSLTVDTGSTGMIDIDKVRVSPQGGGPNGIGFYGASIEKLPFEAETAAGIDPAWWEQVNDPDASGGTALRSIQPEWGQRIEIPDFGAGTITLRGQVTTPGTYYLWARSIRPGGLTGSMWVRTKQVLDGEDVYSDPAHFAMRPSAEWSWSRLSVARESVGIPLEAGVVDIEIQAKSLDGTLDQLMLTNGAHYIPSLNAAIDPVDDVWPAGGAFDMITEGDHQYVAYYNDEARIRVAHRDLGSTLQTWETKTLTDPRAEFTKNDGFDTHNYLTMAVDSDGNLHLAGNMHVEPMTYYRTTSPPDDITGNHINTLTPGSEIEIDVDGDGQFDGDMPEAESGPRHWSTYPVFIDGPNGELFFKYRGGTSGDGEEYLNRYDSGRGTWSAFQPAGTDPASVPVPLLAACDSCQYEYECNECQREYAYNKIAYHEGRYHLAWIWRTRDYSGRTNVISSHDISYAWSEDLENWYTAEDVNGSDPLEWPLTYDGPEGFGDRPEPDPGQDPKVIEWLPPGTADPLDDVAMQLGSGLHNSRFGISFTPDDEPVVSYTRNLYPDGARADEVDSIVVNARLTDQGTWDIHDFPIPADEPCAQTTEQDEVGPAEPAIPGELYIEPNGNLTQEINGCNGGWQNYDLDDDTAAFVDRVWYQPGLEPLAYREQKPVPNEISEIQVSRPRSDFCGERPGHESELAENTGVMTAMSRGEATGGRQFFALWHRLPHDHFHPPAYCEPDPNYPLQPSRLRIYEARP